MSCGPIRVWCIVVIGLLWSTALRAQTPLATAFTYQGQLKEGGVPANGEFDFLFRLFDSDNGFVQVGSVCVVYDQAVTNGLFAVELEFGAGVFTGDALWLEVAVRPSGSSVYAFLSPRQAVTAAPYALALPGLWTVNNATSPNVIGGWDQNSVSSGVVGGIVAGGGSPSANLVTDHHGTVSGGSGNRAGDNDGHWTTRITRLSEVVSETSQATATRRWEVGRRTPPLPRTTRSLGVRAIPQVTGARRSAAARTT